MTLRQIIKRLKEDLAGTAPYSGFGTRVGQLRKRLIEIRSGGEIRHPNDFEEGRAILAELDRIYLHTIEESIQSELHARKRATELEYDVARLERFIERTRKLWEIEESIALREALSLLAEIGSAGFTIRCHPRKKTKNDAYQHHPTLDDDFDSLPKIKLVSGGAFEMDRRGH